MLKEPVHTEANTNGIIYNNTKYKWKPILTLFIDRAQSDAPPNNIQDTGMNLNNIFVL